MLKEKLLAGIVALPLLVGATGANAAIIGLVIDGSGSISAGDFTLQKQGYVNALTTLLNADGQNTIGVWQFSTGVQLEFALTNIATAQDKQDLLDAIDGMTQLAGLTAIGDGVNAAAAAIGAWAGAGGPTKIIDVSTDGFNNTGADPNTASSNAFGAGIAVNCLGVGPGASCSFNDPNFGFDIIAPNFAAFETAITQKLSVELNSVPEPGTLALFGFSLIGLAGMRKRKKA